ncbi:hypothetical protein B0H14DRAFT_2599886 [Mycena olivaceomarginata]|nr:hypothetical protein B0H14DRAFT_2599886 [Mycena olivaceomarginata]
MNGEKIVEDEDQDNECSKMIPKGSRCKSSTTQGLFFPLNGSTSVDDGTVSDETIQVSTLNTEHVTRSGSTSFESDVPSKRLKLGPLEGWGGREEWRQHECDKIRSEAPERVSRGIP